MRAGLQNRPRPAIASLSLLALLFAHTVAAEERLRPALELAAGALLFEDDGPRSVMPYAVVGAGLFQTSQRFPNNDTFTSSEGAFTASGGVRTLVGEYVTVGAEARVGWELHLRVNGTIGIQLGK